MTLHHWVHLLWANQAASAMLARRLPTWRAALRIVWAIVRARSLNPWRVMAKLSTIGRRCDIHPTAVVEASTLGCGVTVGPYARVAFSHIGDGATILSGAEVEASTIGEGATVGQRCGLRLCVVYPEAMASQILMQACVIGRRTITVPGSYSIDLNFDRDIRVMLDGELRSTGTRFLGSAFGHDCRIGTGVWLASGRSIPSGSVVIRDPALVAHRVPERAGDHPLVNDRGTLRPLGGDA
jgi:NDP-sugar pyrophosphorylase family protein